VACDVFGTSEVTPEADWYKFSVCGARPGLVTSDVGLQFHVPFGLEKLKKADTIVALPTCRVDEIPEPVLEALRQAHLRGSRIISLCTGAFVLAKAGLLDGRRATTHWSECAELVGNYPDVIVDPKVLFVDEGDILTSAGSAAGIDLCLHIVRQDYGSEIATQLARQLVVPPQRDGGQAQFIEMPLAETDKTSLFADTISWAQEHLNESMSVNDLAVRSAMSPRTFARRFLAVTGSTPHQWLQSQRVQLAQQLLEATELSIEEVARSSGFLTAGNLRKHFTRVVHTSPQAYRRAFKDRWSA
jgi:transcriptional regulator GlxA family with amidase domain